MATSDLYPGPDEPGGFTPYPEPNDIAPVDIGTYAPPSMQNSDNTAPGSPGEEGWGPNRFLPTDDEGNPPDDWGSGTALGAGGHVASGNPPVDSFPAPYVPFDSVYAPYAAGMQRGGPQNEVGGQEFYTANPTGDVVTQHQVPFQDFTPIGSRDIRNPAFDAQQPQDAPPSSDQLGISARESGQFLSGTGRFSPGVQNQVEQTDTGFSAFKDETADQLRSRLDAQQPNRYVVSDAEAQHIRDLIGSLNTPDPKTGVSPLADMYIQGGIGAAEIKLAAEFAPDALKVLGANAGRLATAAKDSRFAKEDLGMARADLGASDFASKLADLKSRLGKIGPADKGGLIDQPDFLAQRGKALEKNVPEEFQTGPHSYGHGDTKVPSGGPYSEVQSQLQAAGKWNGDTAARLEKTAQLNDTLDAARPGGVHEGWTKQDDGQWAKDFNGQSLKISSESLSYGKDKDFAKILIDRNIREIKKTGDDFRTAMDEMEKPQASESDVHDFMTNLSGTGFDSHAAEDAARVKFGDAAVDDYLKNYDIHGTPDHTHPDGEVHFPYKSQADMTTDEIERHLYDVHGMDDMDIPAGSRDAAEAMHENDHRSGVLDMFAHNHEGMGPGDAPRDTPPQITGGAGNDVPGAKRFTAEQDENGKWGVVNQQHPGGPKRVMESDNQGAAERAAEKFNKNHERDANIGPAKSADQVKAALTPDEIKARQLELLNSDPEAAKAFESPTSTEPLRSRLEALRQKDANASDQAKQKIDEIAKMAQGKTYDQTSLFPPKAYTNDVRMTPIGENLPAPLEEVPGKTPQMEARDIPPTDYGRGGDVGPANPMGLESTRSAGPVQPGIPKGAPDMRGAPIERPDISALEGQTTLFDPQSLGRNDAVPGTLSDLGAHGGRDVGAALPSHQFPHGDTGFPDLPKGAPDMMRLDEAPPGGGDVGHVPPPTPPTSLGSFFRDDSSGPGEHGPVDWGRLAENLLTAPKTLVVALSPLHAGLRHLLPLVTHPIALAKGGIADIATIARYIKDPENAAQVLQARYAQMRTLADLMGGQSLHIGNSLGAAKGEEDIASNILNNIPILGRFFEGSQKGFQAFLNEARFNAFQGSIKQYEHFYGRTLTPEEGHNIAEAINHGSGRGFNTDSAGAALISRWANIPLFSPQLQTSRIRMAGDFINGFQALARGDFSNPANIERVRNGLGYLTSVGGMVIAAKAAGLKVDTNILSSNFMKADLGPASEATGIVSAVGSEFGITTVPEKGGHVYMDLSGGSSTYIRDMAQLITGKVVNQAGQKQSLDTGKFGGKTSDDTIVNMAAGKLSPEFRALWEMGGGNKTDLTQIVAPIFIHDMLVNSGAWKPPETGANDIRKGLGAAPGNAMKLMPKEIEEYLNSLKGNPADARPDTPGFH